MLKTMGSIKVGLIIYVLFLAMVLSGKMVVGHNGYEISIEFDPSSPGWKGYDLSVENLEVEMGSDGKVIIKFDIKNLGLCKATSGYGWYSADGRSCWGEWDFIYEGNGSTDIKFRVGDSSPNPGATYRIELDGLLLGNVTVPANDSWYIVTIHNVSITHGYHTLFLGTYNMDYEPDFHLDYIIIGEKRIEAENYTRMGGNDPNPDFRGLTVYPRDVKVQIWNGKPFNGMLIKEIVVGREQTVIDRKHLFNEYTYTAHYIENNGVFSVKTSWDPSVTSPSEIYVVVDPSDDIKEMNEENNVVSADLNGIINPSDDTLTYAIIVIVTGIIILLLVKRREEIKM